MERNYLKYWKIAKYWAKKVYNLSEEDLETLLFIYKEEPFNKTTFGVYDNMNVFTTPKLSKFLKKGLITQYRKKTSMHAALYEISSLGSKICTDVYSILEGKKRVPMLDTDTFKNKVYNHTVKKITGDDGRISTE